MPPPAHIVDDSTGKIGDRLVDFAGDVVDVQDPESVLVRNEGDLLAILGEIELLHIPGNRGAEIGVLAAAQVNIGEPMKLGFLVGGGIDSFAVFAESPTGIRNLLSPFWRQQGLLAVLGVCQPEIAFIGRHVLHRQDLPAIRRPVECAPTSAFKLRHHVVGLWLVWIDHPQVHIFACAASRTVRQLSALLPPDRARVARLAICQQRDLACVEVVAIKLVELSAAHVLAEDEVIALGRLILSIGHGVGIERQLRARATGHLHAVNFRDIGEAGRDQHFATRRVPVGQVGSAEVAVSLHGFGERGRNLGNAFRHETFVRNDLSRLCCDENREA